MFDKHNIPMDVDSKGNEVIKPTDMSRENRHRAKILTSKAQIMQRHKLVNNRRLNEYNIKKKLYEAEKKEHDLNKSCEAKLAKLIIKITLPDILVQNDTQEEISFHSVHSHLTYVIASTKTSGVLNSELKSFIRVRSPCSLKHSKIHHGGNVPTNKEQLLRCCVEMKGMNLTESICSNPTFPTLLSMDD